MEIYRDGKKLDGPNAAILILCEGFESADQDIPLRTEMCRDLLVRDHGYRGWLDDLFDVACVFDSVVEEFDLEKAVQEIDVPLIMGYERVVVLGTNVWMALHEALNRRSETENLDFQNDMCGEFQVAGYKWLRILRLPSLDEIDEQFGEDEDELENVQTIYRAFVGLPPDRAAEHADRMAREAKQAQREGEGT